MINYLRNGISDTRKLFERNDFLLSWSNDREHSRSDYAFVLTLEGRIMIIDSIPCQYLTNSDLGLWVRDEQCYRVNGQIFIGIRPEPRFPIQIEQDRCKDGDRKTYPRYRIGDGEWICILPK